MFERIEELVGPLDAYAVVKISISYTKTASHLVDLADRGTKLNHILARSESQTPTLRIKFKSKRDQSDACKAEERVRPLMALNKPASHA